MQKTNRFGGKVLLYAADLYEIPPVVLPSSQTQTSNECAKSYILHHSF